jgi:hypothetical protein
MLTLLDLLALLGYRRGMTNTGTDVELAELVAEATQLGEDAGEAAGTWVEIHDEATARRALQLAEDGDPAWDNEFGSQTAPLSGEWSDSMTPRRLMYEEMQLIEGTVTEAEEEAILSAYEAPFFRAYGDEVSRMAKVQLD